MPPFGSDCSRPPFCYLRKGGVICEHGEYRRAVAAGLLDRIQRFRAASNDVFDFLRRAVVDADVVLGLEQTAGHGLSHAAKPDESDLHADSLLLQDRPFAVILRRLRVARLSKDERPREAKDKGHLTGANSKIGSGGQCPLWVKSRHVQCKTVCPLYPESDIKCDI